MHCHDVDLRPDLRAFHVGASMALHDYARPVGSMIEGTGSITSKVESRIKDKQLLHIKGVPARVSSGCAPTLGDWGNIQQDAENAGETGWDAGGSMSIKQLQHGSLSHCLPCIYLKLEPT